MSVFGLFKRGNRASEHVTQERLAVCEVCPDRAGPVCGVCGCVLALKTKLVGMIYPPIIHMAASRTGSANKGRRRQEPDCRIKKASTKKR